MAENKSGNVYSVLIVLQSIIFACIDVFGKIAFRYVSVESFLALRFLIATTVLFILYGKQTLYDLKKVSPKHYLVPAMCLSVSIIFSNIAIRITEATSYSFIRNLTALIVPILMCIFFHRKYTVFDLILQFLLVVGLYLLCAKGGLSGFGAGEVLALGASVLVAVTLVWGADSVNYVTSTTLTTIQMSIGFVLISIYGLLNGSLIHSSYLGFTMPKVIFILLFNSLIGTVIGYIIQNIALKHISSKVVGIVQSTYPVATFAFAHFLLDENLNTSGLLGAAIIIACVIVQSTRD